MTTTYNLLKPLQNKKDQRIFGVPEKKAVFFSGTPNSFGPSYFEATLGIIHHRRRNKRYFFQNDLGHGSSTLQFLQFWYQNVDNIFFLVVNSLEVTSGVISKLMKKLHDSATIELFDI